MKTIKWLKISSILQFFFCINCVLSIVCFAVADRGWVLRCGEIAALLWALNPIGIISFVRGMVLFLKERKIPEQREYIGNMWKWFIVWLVITMIFYLASAILVVSFTGGA